MKQFVLVAEPQHCLPSRKKPTQVTITTRFRVQWQKVKKANGSLNAIQGQHLFSRG